LDQLTERERERERERESIIPPSNCSLFSARQGGE